MKISAKTIILEPLAVTIRYLFKKPVTVQYPEEKLEISERFRGFLSYNYEVCTACLSCERNCPNQCIKIKSRKENKKRIVEEFLYFAGRCMFCGICHDVCPTKPKSIHLTKNYELADTSRESLVFDLKKFYYRGD
jgi:NADH-quinone oxidoreductase chain I